MDDNKEQIKLLLLPYAGGSALFILDGSNI